MSIHFLTSSTIPAPTLNNKQPFCLTSSTSFKNPTLISYPVKLTRSSTTVTFATTTIEPQEQATTPTSKPPKSPPFRVGHGFDLHRLEPGYPLIIGGINIPHDRGCEAHSDGDVLLHCVVDAILGALGLPDIGQIFPDNDPTWKGAPSSVFIKEASWPCYFLCAVRAV